MDLNTAYAGTLARRKDLHLFFLFYLAGDERAGHDRAKAFHGKNAVDRQAEQSFRIARGDIGRKSNDFALQFVQPSAFERTDSDDRRTADIEKRSAHEVFYLHADDAERVFIHHV